jgi:penicillin-binding protein 2
MKVGYAFADHIKAEKIKRRHYKDGSNDSRSMRSVILVIFLFSIVGLLLFRIAALQIAEGSYYRSLSDANRLRKKVIHAPRGVIFDRAGTPLVYNMPGFRQRIKDKTVHLNKDEAITKIADGAHDIEVATLREYPFKDATAHVLGYVGQLSEEQTKDELFASYDVNDWIGKTGIEWEYEEKLKGVNGQELLEVDAMGKPIRTLGKTDPIPGEDITLTIDAKLQQVAFDAMKNVTKGVAIASTPNGEILAMVSKPSFDPNLFTLDTSYKAASEAAYKDVSAIITDGTNQPLLNRAIGGVYPPASTFKIITSAAGLEEGIINETYRVADTGVLKIGEFSFANWFFTQYGKKEPGELDVRRALARSNDIFFYKLAQKINEKRLSDVAARFGFGRTLGIDLAGEEEGLIPSDAWKKKVIGEQWYLGDTFHYGIGQGYLLSTPLQVNTMTQTVANGGILYQPHLLKSGKHIAQSKDLINDKTEQIIREGMVQACSAGGTAYPLFDFKVKNEKLTIDNKNILTSASDSATIRRIPIACKTGTAQHGGEHTLPHAWITLYAPVYDPEIIVTVLNESAGEGSAEAAPIAKKILQAWFEKQ